MGSDYTPVTHPAAPSSLAHPSPVPTMLCSDYSIFPQPTPALPCPFPHPWSGPWLRRDKEKFPISRQRSGVRRQSHFSSAHACALDRHSGSSETPCGGRSIPGHYSYFGNGGAADRYLFPVERPGQTAVSDSTNSSLLPREKNPKRNK